MDRDGSSCRPNFFLPVKVLSRLFRGLFLAKLRTAHQAGRLKFFGGHTHLDDAGAFKAYLAPLRNIEWVIYAKRPFGGPQAVLAYLARYSHRIAISNRRLMFTDETGVTFKYKDYRIEGPGRYKTMTLATDEFIRRFLIHVLPKGFHRIRHYGLLGQHQPSRKHRARAQAARHAVLAPNEPDTPKAAIDEPRVAAASMPVLRRTHDRHRDFRARLRAKAQARATSSGNQDRYLMMPSPPIDNSYHPCRPRRLTAAATELASVLEIGPYRPRKSHRATCQPLVRPTRSSGFAATRPRQPLLPNLFKPSPAAQSPSRTPHRR